MERGTIDTRTFKDYLINFFDKMEGETIDTRTFKDYLINFFIWNKKFPLNSKAQINLATKTIAYDSDNTKDNCSAKRMFEFLVQEVKKYHFDDNEKLRQLNGDTRNILQFTKLKGAFLENFLGYKRI